MCLTSSYFFYLKQWRVKFKLQTKSSNIKQLTHGLELVAAETSFAAAGSECRFSAGYQVGCCTVDRNNQAVN